MLNTGVANLWTHPKSLSVPRLRQHFAIETVSYKSCFACVMSQKEKVIHTGREISNFPPESHLTWGKTCMSAHFSTLLCMDLKTPTPQHLGWPGSMVRGAGVRGWMPPPSLRTAVRLLSWSQPQSPMGAFQSSFPTLHLNAVMTWELSVLTAKWKAPRQRRSRVNKSRAQGTGGWVLQVTNKTTETRLTVLSYGF